MRARVVAGAELGPVAHATYTEVAGSIVSATSTLPLVVVETLGEDVSTDEVAMTPIFVTVVERGPGGTTTVVDAADYSGFAGLRVRGSSSAEFPKKQYKLELWEDVEDSLDADLLGLGAESDWVLYAPGRYDRAFVNNPLAYTLAGEMGLPTMQTRFCELYLNDGGGPVTQGDYDGIYVLTESIKISPERIDVGELGPEDVSEPEVSGGYIYSVDRVDVGEHFWFTQSGFPASAGDLPAMNIVRPKLVDLVPEQIQWSEDFFDAFELALFGPTSKTPCSATARSSTCRPGSTSTSSS